MGLKSKLFSGDRKLEACLVTPSAHILSGAVGDHVSKIQQAIMLLDKVAIDGGELQGKRYGQSTASAVLAYKKKRSIVNFSYQKTADNIVGQMTIDRLDKEMFDKEKVSPLPLPPLPEPTSRSFSIRSAVITGGLALSEPPDDRGTSITGGPTPQWYQVTDLTNQRKAVYRLAVGFEVPSQVGPEQYRRQPRQFSIPQALPLSQLTCNALYTSTVPLNSSTPSSKLELQLPGGRVILPMFLHALFEVKSSTISSSGRFRFSHFGFEIGDDLSRFQE